MRDPRWKVPFNLPSMVGNELRYISEAVSGGQLAGGGFFTRRCESWLEQRFGVSKVLLTHSCTAALELAALVSGVGAGDEVLMPSFTFVSTANAFVLRGARPVFVDVRPDTLNLDETQVEERINERTRAIVPVHYAGVGCEMETVLAIARRHRLQVIEDAAQGVGASYGGRPLGTLGELGCWSFHETKNFISGEGGALAIRDEGLVERAEILREKGTDRARFFRGEVDKYTWVDVGSSFLPSELVAAFLFAQLEQAEEITRKRLAIYERYQEGFTDLADAGLLTLPTVPPDCVHNGHMYYLLLADETQRDALLHHLGTRGVNAVFHYVPLHQSPMGRRLGYAPGELPVTEDVSRRLVRLPCYFTLDEGSQELVVREVRRFLKEEGR